MSDAGELRFAGRYSGRAQGALIPAIHMAPGNTQTIYLTASGAVYDFGANNRGQLGNGTLGLTSASSSPVHVKLPGSMKQVGSGLGTSWAVSADGRHAYAWGDNTHGQLGIGERAVRRSATPVPIHIRLPRGVTIVQMADGLKEELALLSNGKVLAWGDNRYGQCGRNPKTYGKYLFRPRVVPRLKNVTELVQGDYYSMALKADGTVWAWGQNTTGELGPNGPTPKKHAHSFRPVRVTGLPKIQHIVAGGRNAIAIDANGHVWEWGRDKLGELGNGMIDGADGPHPTPSMVAGLPPVVSLDSEGPTVVAADAKGHVYAWGFNKWGTIGDGTTVDSGTPRLVLTVPTSPDGQVPSVQVAAAHFSSYAYNVVTGRVYAWGKNNYGQIGIPANETANPQPIDISSRIRPTLAPVCFCAGTRIRTSRGDQPIETLSVGDLAITGVGAPRPIKWLGRRTIDCRRHPRPGAVLPVRIAAHAFGENHPARALLLSPGHAICVDVCGEVLVPAGLLINGTTIAQIEMDEVTYWHVEFETHDILLAENLACESYLEMGNRDFFVHDTVVRLRGFPDGARRTHAEFCRLYQDGGPIVEAARLRLRVRAEAHGNLGLPASAMPSARRLSRVAADLGRAQV